MVQRSSIAPRVLLLELEFPTWRAARHWSYASGLGIEEGLRANNVEHVTITSPWFSEARHLLGGARFDQVWLDIGRAETLDEEWLDWVSHLAPVRVGFIPESLEYGPTEAAIWSELTRRKQKVESRLPYVTHVLACDEKDVDTITSQTGVTALWWPQAVPERWVSEPPTSAPGTAAVFCGSAYGERRAWLAHPDLVGLLRHARSPEQGTLYPALFDALHLPTRSRVMRRLCAHGRWWSAYLACLRRIRQQCFRRWLETLRASAAVVNLPHVLKAYSGRVVEGMAAGRPVVSWDIPNRPQNRALFADGDDILLYATDAPSQLAAQLERVNADPAFARRIAEHATRKVRAFHTVEHRVRQILTWIETGQPPRYE